MPFSTSNPWRLINNRLILLTVAFLSFPRTFTTSANNYRPFERRSLSFAYPLTPRSTLYPAQFPITTIPFRNSSTEASHTPSNFAFSRVGEPFAIGTKKFLQSLLQLHLLSLLRLSPPSPTCSEPRQMELNVRNSTPEQTNLCWQTIPRRCK